MMIRLWLWDEAPDEWKQLSPHGGDEDWVVHIPAQFIEGWNEGVDDFFDQVEPYFTKPSIETVCLAIGVCDTSYHELDDGSVVAIGAHA